MRRNRLNFDAIQDEHLDTLLRLAYRQMDAMEAQEILSSADGSVEMTGAARTAYGRYLEKLSEAERAERRRARRAKWRKRFPRIVEAAACLIIIIGLATPFALANVDFIRVRVLEMLIRFQYGHVDIDLVENEEAAFDVPADWPGLYYPSYIPEGYEISDRSMYMPDIEFKNEDGMKISFSEWDETTASSVDSEGAIISFVDVNGAESTVLDATELGKNCSVIWSVDNRYFIVTSRLSAEQALEVARGVKKIQE